MEKTFTIYEIAEFEFSKRLSHFLQTFNILDHNIGLCISFLVNYRDNRAAFPLIDKLNTQAKMDVLKELIFYKNAGTNEDIIKDFEKWYKIALKNKSVRNRYVHGRWHVSTLANETLIFFDPTSWSNGVGKTATKENSGQEMSLEKFEEIVQEMDNVFEQFSMFRKKYGI